MAPNIPEFLKHFKSDVITDLRGFRIQTKITAILLFACAFVVTVSDFVQTQFIKCESQKTANPESYCVHHLFT